MATDDAAHGDACAMRVKRKTSSALPKAMLYESLLAEARDVLAGQTSTVANLANVSAVIFHGLNDWLEGGKYTNWCGFYMCSDSAQLCTLGPFQGRSARVSIPYSKGVCGATASKRSTTVVPNVHEFPGHIACDSVSEAEIVVPVFSAAGELVAILDIDAPTLGRFDDTDRAGLEAITALLSTACDWPAGGH